LRVALSRRLSGGSCGPPAVARSAASCVLRRGSAAAPPALCVLPRGAGGRLL